MYRPSDTFQYHPLEELPLPDVPRILRGGRGDDIPSKRFDRRVCKPLLRGPDLDVHWNRDDPALGFSRLVVFGNHHPGDPFRI